jgi:hypothetical protein
MLKENFLNKYFEWDEIKYWIEIIIRKGRVSTSSANHTQLRFTVCTLLQL